MDTHKQEIGKVLKDVSKPLKERFRALFTLKNLGGQDSIDIIAQSFQDDSALLKHELAYCLGQMQDKYAIPFLIDVLKDTNQETMVRHEAGEALGAIGSADCLPTLEQYVSDPVIEVAETCQLAVARIKWLQNSTNNSEKLSENPYLSVDPAPPSSQEDIDSLKANLLNEDMSLFDRYRALFSLRNIGTAQSVIALAEGLKCSSALFRHEIAYVLGQMQHDACVQQLTVNLKDPSENPMVRHECAEALGTLLTLGSMYAKGSIATEECMKILEEYVKDNERVVRESCEVALDMCEYENSDSFQYADTMAKLKQGENLIDTTQQS